MLGGVTMISVDTPERSYSSVESYHQAKSCIECMINSNTLTDEEVSALELATVAIDMCITIENTLAEDS